VDLRLSCQSIAVPHLEYLFVVFYLVLYKKNNEIPVNDRCVAATPPFDLVLKGSSAAIPFVSINMPR
jgi:hypothetical protein